MEHDSVTITINQKEGSISSTKTDNIEQNTIIKKPKTIYHRYRIYIQYVFIFYY